MNDAGGNIFQNALSDFTFEAACGAAIRHLADSGCTARQIMERLDYPVSGERVRKALYKHLCDRNVILEKSPEEGLPESKPEYILEYDSYGKPSYRRRYAVPAGEKMAGPDGAEWTETVYKPDAYLGEGPGLFRFLSEKYGCNGDGTAFVSCDFGIPGSGAAEGILLLDGRQREYLEGILWPRHRVYHRLDYRMKEIICSLYGRRAYEGVCYFLPYKEKVRIVLQGQHDG